MAYHRPSKYGDCKYLAPNLREEDKAEVWASHGFDPLSALRFSFLASEECNTIIGDKQDIIGMFGVTKHTETIGVPWLLMSDEIYNRSVARQFVPESKRWVKEINNRYPILVNFIDVDNTRAIKWLRLIGFTFIRLDPEYGVNPKPFYEFVRIKE
jgi:hypothetical protein